MRYELNFEAEPFAGYTELDLLKTKSGFNREVFLPSHSGELEKEFKFEKSCTVELVWRDSAVPLAEVIRSAPTHKGLYVVLINRTPWYVGKAESGIRERFAGRERELRPYNMTLSDLARCAQTRGRDIAVNWLTRIKITNCREFRWTKGNYVPNRLASVEVLLQILEMYYIWNLQTHANFRRGNTNHEKVKIHGVGSISIFENRGAIRRTLTINQDFDPRTTYSGGAVSLVASP